MRHLFEFKLADVEEIIPWGDPPNLTLSWFALSDGTFRMNVGNDILFRYSNTFLSKWNEAKPNAEYQIAAFARDFLGSVAPAVNPLPDFLQSFTEDWTILRDILERSKEHESHYEAFRWLGERSPWTGYLNSCPEVTFIRRRDEILIGWDNRNCFIDEIPVWEAQFGTFIMSVDDFLKECRSFANRLLDEMLTRIRKIESGEVKAKIPLDVRELFEQHDSWHNEINGYFKIQETPDVSWEETKCAIEAILNEFPVKKYDDLKSKT